MNSPEGTSTAETQMVDAVQERIAKKATTVTDFQAKFRQAVDKATDAGLDTEAFKKRAKIIDKAAEGNGDLRVEETPANVLAQARINGGRQQIRMSANELLAPLKTEADVKEVQHTAGHEGGHAKAVELEGTLTYEGQAIEDNLILDEGFAELEGNDAVSMSPSEHRPNQPPDVYGEGQTTVAGIQGVVGKDVIQRVFTKTGNLSEIQRLLDEQGKGRTQAQKEEVLTELAI